MQSKNLLSILSNLSLPNWEINRSNFHW